MKPLSEQAFASRLDGSAKQFRRKVVEEFRISAPRKKSVIGVAALSLGDGEACECLAGSRLGFDKF